jgi:hypothetical protein
MNTTTIHLTPAQVVALLDAVRPMARPEFHYSGSTLAQMDLVDAVREIERAAFPRGAA